MAVPSLFKTSSSVLEYKATWLSVSPPLPHGPFTPLFFISYHISINFLGTKVVKPHGNGNLKGLSDKWSNLFDRER